jgi:hypothetical protein
MDLPGMEVPGTDVRVPELGDEWPQPAATSPAATSARIALAPRGAREFTAAQRFSVLSMRLSVPDSIPSWDD